MSTNISIVSAVMPAIDRERGHRRRLAVGYMVSISLIAAVAIYGFGYYTLDTIERPFSPKHVLLKPSGVLGVKLGMLGFLMFLIIFLYPIRKRWAWLASKGSSKHWLDFHVLLGLSAPFIIALHSSFKFRGFAGMAFWIMLAVSISGVVGRYLYAQIPRRLNSAELTRKELQDLQERLAEQLSGQRLLPVTDLRSVLRMPSAQRVARLPALVALAYMMVLDLLRPFRIAKLRRHALGFGHRLLSLGGLLPSGSTELERAIRIAREEAALSKRILFLGRSQQVFRLWHIVHRPFSYSFALLVLIHVAVVTMMGFF